MILVSVYLSVCFSFGSIHIGALVSFPLVERAEMSFVGDTDGSIILH